MPVVPYVRKEDSRGQGFSPQKPPEAADEPWLLMAAAQMDAQGRLLQAPGTFMGELKEGSPEHKAWTEGPANSAIKKPDNPEEFMKNRPDEEGAILPGSNMLWLRKKQPPRDDKDLVS